MYSITNDRLKQGKRTYVAFIDLKKAFDIIPRRNLFGKPLILGFELTISMEISIKGDLANWSTGKGIPAVGGAMDLVAGAKNVFVMTQHVTKEGKPKLVKECSLPLTGANVVSRVYSDYAVMQITDIGFKVLQLNTNITLDYLKSVTEGNVYQ